MVEKKYSFKRSDRVGELLHREIGRILLSEVKDPRLRDVTVMAVRASDDLREATVFVSVRGENESRIIESLGRAGSFIRTCLGRRCYLKYVPQLHFKLDSTLEEAARIDRIIEQLHSENNPAAPQSEASPGNRSSDDKPPLRRRSGGPAGNTPD